MIKPVERRLNNKYIREISQKVIHEMDDDAAELLAQEIQKEIDREILETVEMQRLETAGWTRVDVIAEIGHRSLSRLDWLLENAQGEFKIFPQAILFEQSQDATMFILRWS